MISMLDNSEKKSLKTRPIYSLYYKDCIMHHISDR